MPIIVFIIAVVGFLLIAFFVTGVMKRAPKTSSSRFEDKLRQSSERGSGTSGYTRSSGGAQTRAVNSGDRTSSNTSGDNYVYVPLMDGSSSSPHVSTTTDTPACHNTDTPASSCSNPNCSGGSSCGGSSCGGSGCGGGGCGS